MPTLLRIKALIFILHTREHGHPHITVYSPGKQDSEAMAKVRLDEIEIIESYGFHMNDLRFIMEITKKYQEIWMEAWNVWVEGKD
jgi:hypothetical protein